MLPAMVVFALDLLLFDEPELLVGLFNDSVAQSHGSHVPAFFKLLLEWLNAISSALIPALFSTP